MVEESTIKELSKSQNIRAADVFVIAPFLIFASLLQRVKFLSLGLLVIGIMTLLYNADNYIKNMDSK